MKQIGKDTRWAKNDSFSIPGMLIPSFRTSLAVQNKIEKNILVKTWGGIGDQICAEPTLRYALSTFKNGEKVSLASELPELFAHLPFHEVYDLRKERPVWDDFLIFETIVNHDIYNLSCQFMSHSVINCVDFPALCAFRCQLPIADKEVVLVPSTPQPDTLVKRQLLEVANDKVNYVIVHAGKHWQSKTFPKDWWDDALSAIIKKGFTPVLIGKEVDEGQGTVAVNTEGCLDLRNKTTIMETVWLCQNAAVVLCNDSSPLHMSVTGDAWIGFIASAKHPDFISHWRKGQWSWRMKNLGKGGIWDHMDNCPNREETTQIDKVDETLLRSWLPSPDSIGNWCAGAMRDYFRTV